MVRYRCSYVVSCLFKGTQLIALVAAKLKASHGRARRVKKQIKQARSAFDKHEAKVAALTSSLAAKKERLSSLPCSPLEATRDAEKWEHACRQVHAAESVVSASQLGFAHAETKAAAAGAALSHATQRLTDATAEAIRVQECATQSHEDRKAAETEVRDAEAVVVRNQALAAKEQQQHVTTRTQAALAARRATVLELTRDHGQGRVHGMLCDIRAEVHPRARLAVNEVLRSVLTTGVVVDTRATAMLVTRRFEARKLGRVRCLIVEELLSQNTSHEHTEASLARLVTVPSRLRGVVNHLLRGWSLVKDRDALFSRQWNHRNVVSADGSTFVLCWCRVMFLTVWVHHVLKRSHAKAIW